MSSSPTPAATSARKKFDAVKLLKSDPKVSPEVKKSLAQPCTGNEYPVEVTYASLTGGHSSDVIINVLTCADSVGIGSYVFRERKSDGDADDGGYENVYANEQPTVSAGADEGELEVSTQTYDAGDQVCCPSGEDVLTYRWSDGRFTQNGSHHTDYSKTTVDRTGAGDGTGTEG